jgi:prepilin-type processing-associated H-X9-DG protein
MELLVVMAIIALVAALGIGALSQSRRSAEDAKCLANLRQLAAANLAYVAENGTYCPAMDADNFVRWHGARTGYEAPFDPAKGFLSPYFGAEARLQACPALSHLGVLGGVESFENGGGGYGYNAVYLGGRPGSRLSPNVPGAVPQPAATLMFADTALAKPGGIQEYPFAEPYRALNSQGTKLAGALDPSLHFRHRGKANVAWADGSVTPQAPAKLGGTSNIYGGDSEKYGLGWIGPEAYNGVWNPAYEAELAAGN